MAEHLPSAAAARPPAPLRDFAGTSRGARHWWRSTTGGRSSPATTHRLRLTGAGLCPRSKGGTASGVGGGGCTDGGGERLEKQPDGVRRSVTAMPAQSSSVILFCILARFHVLAVDDSLVDRKLIEILLKNSSYQVTTVNSGRKVLELLGLRDDAEHASSLSSSSPDPQEIDVNLIITDTACPA